MRSLSHLLRRKSDRLSQGGEISNRWFWLGLAVVGGAIAWMADAFWGVSSGLVIATLPLVIILTLLGIHTTALTSITPTGAVARVSQLTTGVLAPRQLTSNVIVGAITADAALHASAFCQHLRPGHLLGARPARQALGHLLGIVAGTACCIPVFYYLFLQGESPAMISDKYPFPAAVVWMGVAKMLTGGSGGLPASAALAAAIAALVGIVLSLPWTPVSRLQLSPVGIGLAFLIPFDISLAIFAGAFGFWLCSRWSQRVSTRTLSVWAIITDGRESICAGLMTGTALAGIAWFAAGS